MSNFQLKIIAIVSMLVDHIAWGLSASPYIKTNFSAQLNLMHIFGRVAFPVFAFLISEGVIHTRNVRKYFTAMCIFAIISEIPYDLLRNVYRNHTFNIFFPNTQNVFFTLALGIAAILFYRKMTQQTDFFSRFFCILLIIITLLTAYFLRVDYGWMMVLAILTLYIFRNSQLRLPVFAIFILAYYLLISYTPQYFWAAGALSAVVLIYFYNGKRGANVNKWLFYAFYPVHLLIIAILMAAFLGYL